MYTENAEILKRVLANNIQRIYALTSELNQLSKETGSIEIKLVELGVSHEEISRIIEENYLH